MMKQNLIPFTAVLAAFALVSCDGGKKQDQSPDASAASEQAVPKTPGEKILAVLLLIQDQATANAHAAEVKELAVALPKDIPHQESVNIMNELLRLASRECYGSLSLEDALKGIQFDAGAEKVNSPCRETMDCFCAFPIPFFREGRGVAFRAPDTENKCPGFQAVPEGTVFLRFRETL